jgi:uncharacterized protein (DUF885 family)
MPAKNPGLGMRRFAFYSAAIVLACTTGAAAAPSPSYQAIVRDYFAGQFKASPTFATATGVHDRDCELDPVWASAHADTVTRLEAAKARLLAVDAKALSSIDRDDRDVLVAEIDGKLLEEKIVQQWRHNPGTYVDLVTGAIYSLIERDFAPLPTRMDCVIARENQIPNVLVGAAEKNLTDMPAVYVDVALENLDGAIGFLKKDVPSAFTSVKDAKLQDELKESTQDAVAAAEQFKAFLIAQKPNAHGSFVMGRDALQRLLASDMVNVPVERVLEAGKAQLAKDRAVYLATEKLVDPKNPSAAPGEIEADHPDAAHLISTARDGLESLQAFINAHHIVTLPSQMLPTVAETPAFGRALVFGELDPPGALETHATKAYYYITPPDPAAPKADQEKLLSYFNRSFLQNLSVHEALPGHFVQYLFQRANPQWSIVRATSGSYTATEGWAHYTEQMMLDEGLGNGDPRLRLSQSIDALLRDCRLVASIEMHTGQITLDQATALMEQQCFQSTAVAPKEARRGTSDPGYFSYTLGKLEILKLRDDMQKKEGANFSLTRFHDRFLNAGLVPIAIIRREMTGQDGPVL